MPSRLGVFATLRYAEILTTFPGFNARNFLACQKLTDECIRLDGLWLVTGRCQHVEMAVFRDDKTCLGTNRAIAEFIVVRVGRNHVETELRINAPDILVKLGKQIQQS